MSYFLLLYFIHLLADFSLQPLRWIEDRHERHFRSIGLIKHVLLHVLLTALLLWNLKLWWVWLSILITHWLTDVWKSYQKSNLQYYLIDQAIHLAVIIVLSVLLQQQSAELPLLGLSPLLLPALAIGSAALLMLRPLGMTVMYFMQNFALEPPDSDALENAGKWIGYFERLIILMSILMSAYTVLGFLVAAKSLLRYSDRAADRKHTEYVLIGSLLSWSLGIAIALLCRFLLGRL